MPADSAFIPRQSTVSAPLSYDDLLARAIELIQASSGELWTDFNAHDPGVTILEQCCYALTDARYRASFDVADYLCDEQGRLEPGRLALHRPQDILPSARVTNADLRKALIGATAYGAREESTQRRQLHLVDWVSVTTDEKDGGLVGLHVVPSQAITSRDMEAQLKAHVARVFAAEHQRGQSLVEVSVFPTILCRMSLHLEINSFVSAESVIAQVVHQACRVLAELVDARSFGSFADFAGQVEGSLSQIFDGPLLSRGVISEDDLRQRTEPIEEDDFHAAFAQIDGVLRSSELQFHAVADHPELNVAAGQCIQLKDALRFAIRLRDPTVEDLASLWPVRNGVSQEHASSAPLNGYLSRHDVSARLYELRAGSRRQRDIHSDPESLQSRVVGTHRPLDDYSSITNHFPAIYGVGRLGIQPDADPAQRVQHERFEGYLGLLDQLLANFSSDLAHLKDLYSVQVPPQDDATARRSYYFQPVRELLDAQTLASSEHPHGLYVDDPARSLADAYVDHDDYLERKNRLLDYLLALHGESFMEQAFLEFSRRRRSVAQQQELLLHKSRLLDAIVPLTGRRGCIEWEQGGYSNFARRVALRMGMADPAAPGALRLQILNTSLTGGQVFGDVETIENLPDSVDLTVWQDWVMRLLSRDQLDPDQVAAIVAGRFRARVLEDDSTRLVVLDERLTAGWDLGRIPRNLGAADAAVWFRQEVTDALEYPRVIEHIALRPRSSADQERGHVRMHHALYAHRVTVVLPNDSYRLSQPAFRATIEDVIEAECPAHIEPEICYLPLNDVVRFDRAYANFCLALNGYRPGGDATLINAASAELREILGWTI